MRSIAEKSPRESFAKILADRCPCNELARLAPHGEGWRLCTACGHQFRPDGEARSLMHEMIPVPDEALGHAGMEIPEGSTIVCESGQIVGWKELRKRGVAIPLDALYVHNVWSMDQ